MIRSPPRYTRTDTRVPYTTLVRSIRTLTLRVKASIRPCESDNEKSPDHRVSASGVEFGAAWTKAARETGAEYLSLKLDDPSFPAPIYATLSQGDRKSTRLNSSH